MGPYQATNQIHAWLSSHQTVTKIQQLCMCGLKMIKKAVMQENLMCVQMLVKVAK